MRGRVICIVTFLLSLPTLVVATENSMNNVLNGNGSIGSVTINQANSVTNEQVESQHKIDESVLSSYQGIKNGDKQAGSLSTIARIAGDVNKQNASSNQKNSLCKSKAKLGAEAFGYKLAFAFEKCDEFFKVQ